MGDGQVQDLWPADVYIDGVKVKRVDLYSATTQWKVPIPFAMTEAGPHTIEVRVLGLKHALATGYNVYLDAFQGPFTLP